VAGEGSHNIGEKVEFSLHSSERIASWPRKKGSAQEFDGACILSRFLKNDKFCFCDRHALCLKQ
jgi:hypothetical protein